jgi:hypothetical protein
VQLLAIFDAEAGKIPISLTEIMAKIYMNQLGKQPDSRGEACASISSFQGISITIDPH